VTVPAPSAGWSISTADGPHRDGLPRPRQRMQPEGDLGDHPERAEAAHEELAEVVARDVLHDLAARLGHDAVGPDERDPDEQVAHRPVEQPSGAAGVRRHGAAQRGGGEGGVERQLLTRAGQAVLQVGHPGAGTDDGDQVARGVLDDAGQPGRVDDEIHGLGWQSPVLLGAGAPRHDVQGVLRGDP
jgi:hypothetical protein